MDIPWVHSGVKTSLGATWQSPLYGIPSWAERMETMEAGRPRAQKAHVRASHGLDVIVFRSFTFPTLDFLTRRG
jgi:hypothetical protein